jgi:cbb3-type cytochrome oxidase subunit 3
MYKEVLRTIVGIEVFPVLSLIIFLAVFLVMLVWVFRMDRGRLATYANLPLQDDGTARAAARRRTDALGGAQL